jgi:hypothetical protein
MSWFDYNYIIEKETLTAIADAIREKMGYPALFKIDPVAMPQKIRGIQSGSTGGEVDVLIARTIQEIDSSATSVGYHAFYECSSLKSVNFPLAHTIYGLAFYNCKKLTQANFGNVGMVYDKAFENCYLLTTADFAKATSFGSNSFKNCRSLVSLIVRSETVCTLQNTTAFSNCYHILGTVDATYNPTGAKDGYIYVPSHLVESYKTATNWSTYASQIRAIDEGGGEEEGNWLFQNEQITSNARDVLDENGNPIVPVTGTSYTLFVDGEEIATSIAESNWDGSAVLHFNTEDYSIYFIYDSSVGGWHFHPVDSQVGSGIVSIRINE